MGGGGGGGGGYSGTLGSVNTPWAGFPVIEAVRGTRPDSSGSGGGIINGGYGGVFDLDSALNELGLGDGFNVGDDNGQEFPDFPEWDY